MMKVLTRNGIPLMVASSDMTIIWELQRKHGRANVFYEAQWSKDRDYLKLRVNGEEMCMYEVPKV